MKMSDIPFGITDWSAVEATEHPGDTGMAYWRTRQFGDVRPGTKVNFQIAGEDQVRSGTIVSSASLNSNDLSSDIRVQIKPDAPLSSAFAGRPVEVSSDRGPSMNWLIDKAMAAGL